MPGKSSRFTVAVHVMTLLANEEAKPLSSEYIAGSVNTNPVVIRRVLGLLAKAKLVRSIEGAGGGTLLTRPANKITLADIFRAVEEGELFSLPRSKPNPACPVGRSVQGVLGQHTAALQTKIEQELSRITLDDIFNEVRRKSR